MSERTRTTWIVAIAALVVLGFWLWLGYAKYHELSNEGASAWGDAFGAVNALFAGFAFVGIIWAIRLQSIELELQRLELKDTRKELARTADAQTMQVNSLVPSAHLNALNNLREYHANAQLPRDRHFLSTVLQRIEDITTSPLLYIGDSKEIFKLDAKRGLVHWFRSLICELDFELSTIRERYHVDVRNNTSNVLSYLNKLKEHFKYITEWTNQNPNQLNTLWDALYNLVVRPPNSTAQLKVAERDFMLALKRELKSFARTIDLDLDIDSI